MAFVTSSLSSQAYVRPWTGGGRHKLYIITYNLTSKQSTLEYVYCVRDHAISVPYVLGKFVIRVSILIYLFPT